MKKYILILLIPHPVEKVYLILPPGNTNNLNHSLRVKNVFIFFHITLDHVIFNIQ